MEQDFSKYLGERVWSLNHGWGTIDKIIKDSYYPIRVMCNNGIHGFTRDGRESDNAPQTLFFDVVKFEIPPEPRQKVKKEMDVWINYYPNFLDYGYGIWGKMDIHPSKEKADFNLISKENYQQVNFPLTC